MWVVPMWDGGGWACSHGPCVPGWQVSWAGAGRRETRHMRCGGCCDLQASSKHPSATPQLFGGILMCVFVEHVRLDCLLCGGASAGPGGCWGLAVARTLGVPCLASCTVLGQVLPVRVGWCGVGTMGEGLLSWSLCARGSLGALCDAWLQCTSDLAPCDHSDHLAVARYPYQRHL